MTSTRKARPDSHRHTNDAAARVYGRVLRGYLQDIEKAPVPSAVIHNAVKLMQDVAVSTFRPAYVRGKTQAMGSLMVMQHQDTLWLDRKLASNYHYLSHSLAPQISAKIERLRLDVPGPRSGALDAAFGARLENLYGGVLWQVYEAGFASGARDLQLATIHIGTPSLHQDDTPDDQQKKDHWAVLALLIGVDEDTLKETWKSLQIGVAYVTSHDDRVCGPCDEAEGDYFPPAIPPVPGEVCDGFGNCRCWLELITRTV